MLPTKMRFEDMAKREIKAIPRGKVATYAQIAALAGNYRAARQVARVLHSSSDKDRLPWHRVINSRGGISLKRGRGFEEQKRLLLREGVRVIRSGRIDLTEFQWEPGASPQLFERTSPILKSKAAQRFWRELKHNKKMGT